jgi:hypothetical protein
MLVPHYWKVNGEFERWLPILKHQLIYKQIYIQTYGHLTYKVKKWDFDLGLGGQSGKK